MRPEDITEQDENGKIKDTEGQLAADENRNETVETEVSQETHSEYKIPVSYTHLTLPTKLEV